MTQPKIKSIFALAMLAMALSGIGTAYGQGYIITGTTPGGGNIVVGNGPLPRIVSGGGILSGVGSDILTLNLGSFAFTNSFGATVKFATPNDTLVNFGTIQGGASGGNTDGGVGVSFLSNNFLWNGTLGTTNLTNETVINHGFINANSREGFELAGDALSFLATDEINGINVTNTNNAFITGANNSFNAFIAGTALSFASENSDITNVNVTNSGNIIGGNDNNDATAVGSGMSFLAGNGISNVNIINNAGGNIIGGNSNDTFNTNTLAISNGIVFLDENNNFKDIKNVSISNGGNIVGGNFSFGDSSATNGNYFISNGIAFGGLGSISNVTINNTSTGLIEGGNSNNTGWFIGTGIGMGAISIDGNNGGTISNVAINNSGLIQGGHSNFSNTNGLEMGTGIAIVGGSSASNITINNFVGGKIIGGDDNDSANNSAGNGIDISADGRLITTAIVTPSITVEGPAVSNLTVNNWGLIRGGGGNNNAFLVANGIGVSGENVINSTINNFLGGTIAGGDGDFTNSAVTGAGIVVKANLINGFNVNNKGLIRGGNDLTGETNTSGGNGIDIFGNNISNVAIKNYFTGIVTGGLGGGNGIFISGDPANVSVMNKGFILGGHGDPNSTNTSGGDALVYNAPTNSTNIMIENYGWIIGGGAANGGGGGAGVSISGNNTDTENWGVIAGGVNGLLLQGIQPAEVNKSGIIVSLGNAVEISGSGNVLNLNGHSAVLGKITVSGPSNSNVVNLNFTGVDATTLKNLNALLKAQGVGSGTDASSVIFTLRGVTYNIDPAIVNGHLLSYQFQGLTPNQAAVGAALDSAKVNPIPGTALFNLYNAIDQSGNVPNALEQLSPQPLQIYGDIALAISTFNTLEIDHRLNNLRDGSEGVDTTGMGGENTAALTSGLSKDDGKGGKKGVITPEREGNRWGFFASGHGIFTNIDAHGGDLQDAGFTTGGLMMGLDGKINERWVVGTFFGYDHTSADLDQRGSTANVDSYTGGLYTGYHNGGYYGNGLFSYTHNDYDSHRNIFLPGFANTANGSTGGNQFTLNADGGYDFRLNDHLTWGPIAGLQYVHMDVDSFNESGAPAANLAVGSQNLDSLRSRLGVRLEYNKQIARRMAFASEVHAEWQHEFLDDSRGISGGFIGDGLAPFSVQTTSPERDAALVGVGANLTVRDKYTFFFDYDAQAGQASYIEQSVKGGVKISW